MFKKRKTIKQVEEGNELAPKFDQNGFIPVVTTDAKSGIVLFKAFICSVSSSSITFILYLKASVKLICFL